MSLAPIFNLRAFHPGDERRVNVTMRDGRLAEARKERDNARAEAALLRRILEGEFGGWADHGGQVWLYELPHRCECNDLFVAEDDEMTEPPAWMTADWLRACTPMEEVKTLEGMRIEGVCAKCAGCC